MSDTTKIEWCDHTASPWHGCSKVAAGCDNCYAERQSVRNPGILGIWGENGTRVKSKSFIPNLRKWNIQAWQFYEQALSQWVYDCCVGYKSYPEPQRDEFTAKVFPSICDPFEDRPELVPWRNEMFAAADECPWVILLLLTKRPENIRRMWPVCSRCHGNGRVEMLEHCPVCNGAGGRKNVWLGTSISTQFDANRNIPELLKCRDLSPVLFASAEPLLEDIDLTDIPDGDTFIDALASNRSHLDHLTIGGESGPKARPCDVSWIRSLRDQCQAAHVPCFIKQLGARPVWPEEEHQLGIDEFRMMPEWGELRDPKGGDPLEWPEDLRVREFPTTKGK